MSVKILLLNIKLPQSKASEGACRLAPPPPTSQRGRGVQAFGLVLLDGLQEVGVQVEQLPLVLPVVAGGDEQAAVLGQHRLHPP